MPHKILYYRTLYCIRTLNTNRDHNMISTNNNIDENIIRSINHDHTTQNTKKTQSTTTSN